MTEKEAREWLAARWPTDRLALLDRYVALLLAGSKQQSLIAPSTHDQVWVRHIVDSAQLIALAPPAGHWLDVGSGAGLPGLVVGALAPQRPITLCEPRRKRAEFLAECVSSLSLARVQVAAWPVLAMTGGFDVVVARAVGSIDMLFADTRHLVSRETRYILPRGSSAVSDLNDVRGRWYGEFHVEPSITQDGAGIVVARGVARK